MDSTLLITFLVTAITILIIIVIVISLGAGWYILHTCKKIRDSMSDTIQGLVGENKRLRNRIRSLEQNEIMREAWIGDIEARLQACLETLS